MGVKARSGLFHGTSGNIKLAVGDAKFMGPNQLFLKYISKRKDVDVKGFFDVVAHGTPTYIQIEQNDKKYNINWRITAKIIKNSKGYHGQGIRLLSCNTGAIEEGFAQNLANKLNVPVKAPLAYLYVTSHGNYFVGYEDKSKYNGRGDGFKTFYPKRRKEK